jgi:uncharacterized protein YkwD
VPLPSNRLIAVLGPLACSCLLALAPAAATAAPAHHAASRLSRTHQIHHARLACAAGNDAAVRHGRAHTALRACRGEQAHRARRVKLRKHSAKAPATADAPPARRNTVQESAAQIAAVLATPCENTELTPAAGNTALVRGAILCLVNQERAQNGRSPLVANAQLDQAAEGHCTELIAMDYFAHVSPNGETPAQRILATGYLPGPNVGYAIGENLAWGTLSLSTPKAIVAAWIASPEHLENMLESRYTETGVGVTPAVPASLGEGQPGASYAQEFGVVLN